MSVGSSGRARFARVPFLAAAALLTVAALLWTRLPPVNQDEFLPLFPLSWLSKAPAARSSILQGYSRTIFGQRIPVRAYPYEGAVKAYLYAATRLPPTIPVFRAANLALLWGACVLFLYGCWRLGDGDLPVTLACLALLVSDVSLFVLGVCGDARLTDIFFGAALVALLYGVVARPRLWKLLPVALVVFLGEWDKLNFVWFVGAGLAGCLAAALMIPLRRAIYATLIATLGCALGLTGTAWLIPEYVTMARNAMAHSPGLFDFSTLVNHGHMMLDLVDPWAAYHRYVDVTPESQATVYVTYRWVFALLYLGVVAAATVLALAVRLRRGKNEAAGRLAFVAACLATLLLLIIGTQDAWAAHHIVVVRPFLYLGLGALVAHTGRGKGWLTAGMVGLACASAYVGARAFDALRTAPQVPGYYNISWNAVDAWQAAARSDVRAVYALDWGVFYPAVVNSPADQRWEMREIANPPAVHTLPLAEAGLDVGFLFKSSGPHRWLLSAGADGQNYTILDQQRFGGHPGEEWVFLVVNTSHWAEGKRSGRESMLDTSNQLKNADFAEGEAYWQHEKWEHSQGTVTFTTVPCDPGGRPQMCAQLQHATEGDSRIIQQIALAPDTLYEIRALARVAGVAPGHKGAHLCFMEHPGFAESEELTGDTDWRPLHLYLFNRGYPRRIHFAARLGTFGNVTTGTAWFTDLMVRPVATPERGVPVYDLDTEQ